MSADAKASAAAGPKTKSARRHPMYLSWLRQSTRLAVLILISVGSASAQAAADHGGSISTMASGAAKAKAPKKFVLFSSPRKKGKFLHVVAQAGGTPEETNRQALEERAGGDAGKLLLRSRPSGAQVRVDGKLVGRTPLLLILAPGSYRVEMRGARMELGKQQVDLLPRESRKVLLSLAPRYPARLSLR